MKYLYYYNDGVVKMIADGKLSKAGNLKYITKTLTKQEEKDFGDIRKDKKIKNNKLEIK